MTPKRRVINLSWFFLCLCFSKSLLIKYPNTLTEQLLTIKMVLIHSFHTNSATHLLSSFDKTRVIIRYDHHICSLFSFRSLSFSFSHLYQIPSQILWITQAHISQNYPLFLFLVVCCALLWGKYNHKSIESLKPTLETQIHSDWCCFSWVVAAVQFNSRVDSHISTLGNLEKNWGEKRNSNSLNTETNIEGLVWK